MPDDWLDDLDKKKIEKEARYIKYRSKYVEYDLKRLASKIFEDVLEEGETNHDKGIIDENGELIEKKDYVYIGLRRIPVNVYRVMLGMLKKHKNTRTMNCIHRFACKLGAAKFIVLNLKPYRELWEIFNEIIDLMGFADGNYVIIATEKHEYNIKKTCVNRETLSNFHWVDEEITTNSHILGLYKSTMDIIYLILGLSSSDGTYVDKKQIEHMKDDIVQFEEFMEYRYNSLSHTILEFYKKYYIMNPELERMISDINKVDQELCNKILEVIKK